MVFYFSATGNSFWIAKRLATAFNTELVAIAAVIKQNKSHTYNIQKDEPCFFVFPVHSWGPAPLMLRFIASLKLNGYHNQPVHAVCSCGDNCGYTDKILRQALLKQHLNLKMCWSVTMPNNYILMKGFGVDSEQLRDTKLQESPNIVDNIIKSIRSGIEYKHYERGSLPFLKSRIVYPMFCKFVLNKKETLFHAEDNCTKCGLCAKICPTGTISMKDNHPVWESGCVQCTACINRCPVRAIEYGTITLSQGRYCHPDLKGKN